MEVYQKILTNILAQEEINIQFSNLSIDAAQIVEGICYQTINQIRAVLDDVHERHPVPAAQVVVLLEPLQDGAGLGVRAVVPAFLRERHELTRRQARLVLDLVQIRLKGHTVSRFPVSVLPGQQTMRNEVYL